MPATGVGLQVTGSAVPMTGETGVSETKGWPLEWDWCSEAPVSGASAWSECGMCGRMSAGKD